MLPEHSVTPSQYTVYTTEYVLQWEYCRGKSYCEIILILFKKSVLYKSFTCTYLLT